ncbi:AAA family ATPase [uncultured Friedmanniella sp.]|uniref:ATP-binding protein n=1 Tax=uncultured Friedmanniella sp. TaxID=335381 RepID=UPI0035C9ED45
MTGCPQCHQSNAPTARFCSGCGARLVGPTSLREERKRVSVLFCDLVGFTSRSEHLDVEDVRTLLTPYYLQVRSILEQHGGTVEKFIGDAVVGVFGAPRAREDDAERAVRAALAITDRMRQHAGGPGPDLHVRLAVTTGPALVSLDARVRDGEGLVVGDVVNTAARLQTAAPEDGVLVDELTRRLTDRWVHYEAVAPVLPRGRTEAVHPAVAVGLRRDADDRRRSPEAAPMVGREVELARLVQVADRVRLRGRSELVVLVGAPGLGKTRLVTELRQRLGNGPAPAGWRQGRCLPYGEDVALSALAAIVVDLVGIRAADTAAEAEEQVRSTVAGFSLEAEEADWLRRQLAVLVGLGTATGSGMSEAFAAWARFLELVAAGQPVVLLVEDLHWADPLLLDFLDHLLSYAEHSPILVVGTTRPELLPRRPGWQQPDPRRTLVSLAPLSTPETARLLAGLLGRHVIPAELQAPLLDRSGGNPLYAEEWVRMLADRGHLRRGRRTWTGDAVAELSSPPPTVEGITAARLDTLDPEHKQLVQLAAVLGGEGWLEALAALSSLDEDTLSARVAVLERRELIRRTADDDGAGWVRYVFVHALVRDVAYAQIPRAVRGEWHQRCARWLSGLAADRVHDRAELLAHHWRSAHELAVSTQTSTPELVEATRLAARAAADRSRQLHAYAVAAAWYEQALALWPSEDPDRPRLLLHLGSALSNARSAGADLLEEAYAGLVDQGDRELAAEASRRQSATYYTQGDDEAGRTALQRALDLLEPAGPSLAKASVLADTALDQMIAGRPDEALASGRRALEMADALGLDQPAARCGALTAVGVTRLETGDLGGLDDLQEALDTCLRNRAPATVEYHNLANAAVAIGDLARGFGLDAEAQASARLYAMATDLRLADSERAWESYWRGDWRTATRLVERALALSEEGSSHFTDVGCQQLRGLMRLARGDLAGADSDLTAAVEVAARLDLAGTLQSLLPQQAWAQLAGGDVGAAHDTADRAVSFVADGARLASPDWSGPLAMVLDGLGRSAEFAELAAGVRLPTRWLAAARAVAVADFDGAAEVYASIGSRPDEALARLRAGEQHRAEGRAGEAEAQFSRTLTLWRALGARLYLSRVVERQPRYA